MKGPHVLQIVDEQLRLKHQKFSFFPSSRLESSPTEMQSKYPGGDPKNGWPSKCTWLAVGWNWSRPVQPCTTCLQGECALWFPISQHLMIVASCFRIPIEHQKYKRIEYRNKKSQLFLVLLQHAEMIKN